MADVLREIITLGTPYFGAVKAIRMLSSGEGAPATLLSIMFGMIVMHHVVDDVPAHALRSGVALLGAATRTPAPTSTPATQTTP